MTGILAAVVAARDPNAGALDVQTVTSGADGIGNPSFDRRRGYLTAVIGSIDDGTSNLFAGALILEFYWNENGGSGQFYALQITGATNTGWTTLTIDGTLVLTRASATFSLNRWTWTTADTVASQIFGGGGSVHTCVFT